MNKFFRITTVITLFIAVFVVAGATAAFAQGPNQPDGVMPPAMNQGENEAGTGMGLAAVDEAVMHEAIAGALGMTVDEFEAAIAEGKTVLTLAEEQDVDFAEVQAAMDAVHAAALQQAADDGLITQEQADWILSRRGGQNSQGGGMNRGQNNSPMGRLGRGAGGNGVQTGECQYQVP